MDQKTYSMSSPHRRGSRKITSNRYRSYTFDKINLKKQVFIGFTGFPPTRE
ncbi:hypothetical protein [Rickettsia endosymbiont of Ixodes pacificus]|uniref:hypothetical protein n=1 Tax=Rickettsia endosymbiont of Ixodes pacificus TaxID=1133329 RepID=UPI000ADC73D6|nr:hypothetical protein [Rickettsia endosymbiont of Ixodes pacificus]